MKELKIFGTIVKNTKASTDKHLLSAVQTHKISLDQLYKYVGVFY